MTLRSFKQAVKRAGLTFVGTGVGSNGNARTPKTECNGLLCPILALAWHRGIVLRPYTPRLNALYHEYALELGLSTDDAYEIIRAADGIPSMMSPSRKRLRDWMDGVNQ